MKFKDFELNERNHFVAMQYYGLILNRTFLVLIIEDALIGIKVNGLVSVESGDAIANWIVKNMVVQGDLENKYSYMKSRFVDRMQDCDLLDGSILKEDRSNFIIQKADIIDAYHDPGKKWGMGYYPHDGKVYVKTRSGKKIEFIMLGNQSGQQIASLILTT
jgi:hypothetical protein